MGADSSRFCASADDSSDLDTYIKRGGVRLVDRERELTTSTTLELRIGGGGGGGGGNESESDQDDIDSPLSHAWEDSDNSFMNIERVTLEEFQDLVASCTNDVELAARLHQNYSLPACFLLLTMRRALASNKVDLLKHALCMNTLLPEDSNIRVDDSCFISMLMRAVAMEDLEAFSAILPHIKTPMTVTGRTELQSTALIAAQISNIAAVRLLCNKFPMCLEQTVQGRSIFLEAAHLPSTSLQSALADLLEMGVYVNTQDPDGGTALHTVARSGDMEAVKLLLSYKACPTIADGHGKRAVDLVPPESELSKVLIEASLSPLPHEVSLYHAAEQESIQYARQLVRGGVPVNSKWIHGRTALIAAAKVGNVEMTQFLLSVGAEPIPLGSYWPELPVVHALFQGHAHIAVLLMQRTEQLLQRESENVVLWKHIRSQLVYVLHYCAQIGAVSVATHILNSSCRIDPNEDFKHGLAPIHVACRHGQLAMTRLLLEHKTRADLPTTTYCNTPLHYACFYGHTQLAQFLLWQPSVSINCKNVHHATPLYCVLSCELTPNEKSSYIREASVIFLLTNKAMLMKPGRQNCELKGFTLDVASQRWTFVPVQTQKLIIVLRDEGRNLSLASETRLAIRASIEAPISEDVLAGLGLPFRLQKYVLFRDWFSH